jgi:hypothetical protein
VKRYVAKGLWCSSYHDVPLSGMAITPEGKKCWFVLNNCEKNEYVILELSNEQIEYQTVRYQLFCELVSNSWTFGETYRVRELKPTWKEFYEIHHLEGLSTRYLKNKKICRKASTRWRKNHTVLYFYEKT